MINTECLKGSCTREYEVLVIEGSDHIINEGFDITLNLSSHTLH